ncbi:hypothetical protein OG982_25245 [Streptomyces sp. NBC_01551]|uniref:hypothetical protein n=1 Tax=Streptomyces sp. NBC_01551 TaxID=2975876 RepID=UPI00225C0DDB|nr:hypothetical protein [Streptomyces sp. NBC_01551]MCX4528954.1 hypothetical protein [Streptomyces sp. NBC_01551]
MPRAERPTVHHPGRAAVPVRPGAPVPGGAAQNPAPAPQPRAVAAPEAGEITAPPLPAVAVAPVARFHVRPYHSKVLERRGPDGMSTVMLMTVVTTPAVLAAAALRPRGKSRR